MKKYLRMLEISPGGWLLLSLLYFFADFDAFIIVLVCIVIHETGHLLALEHFGVRVRRIVLDFTGVTICIHSASLHGIIECVTALAGPLYGLFVAAVSSWVGNVLQSDLILLFAGCNLVLSAFNLLPAKPLDGWRCLNAIFPVFAQVVSVCTALSVLCAGILVMYSGYGTALAVMGILLLLQENPSHKRMKIGTY